MSLPGDKRRLYTVILFDAAYNEIHRVEHVPAWTRREAYYAAYEGIRTYPYRWHDAMREETNAAE